MLTSDELFKQDSIHKQIQIQYSGGVISNSEIHSENFELTESICTENTLKFGCCEASCLKFRISEAKPQIGETIAVTMFLDNKMVNSYQIGIYKVFSVKPTADRRYKDVVAYDALYDVINSDVSDWYNSLDFPLTMREFRSSFFSNFGIAELSAYLPNDGMWIEETIKPSVLSGKDVLSAILELNGCFGKITRSNNFEYIFLQQGIQGLYPSNDLYPSDSLYPRETETKNIKKSLYISCQYEDFTTQNIDSVQIRQEENDIGSGVVGTGENTYVIEDNFLVYGKTTKDLAVIAQNILKKIEGIYYRPFSAECKGNPFLETGQAIRLNTNYQIIESYILSRTLKGIQDLRDTYEAQGEEKQLEKVNSFSRTITQLKGKTNTLERTVEETRSTITDVEQNLSSRIEQTVKSISLTISNGEKTAGIVISVENEDGTTNEISGNIAMTGIVTFNSLQNAGQTVINGSNITTGQINCSLLKGGEIVGQIFKGGESSGGKYDFVVNNEKTVVRNKFYLKDDTTTYLSFDGSGKGKLSIQNVVLKLGNAIRIDPESNAVVLANPQKIYIKGKGISPGTWDASGKTNVSLSDGTTVSAWDIGDAIQYISRFEIDSKFNDSFDSRLDAKLKEYGLIS